jgi:hypothetical protein
MFLFLETGDFERDDARMTSAGARFVEPPRHEAYGWWPYSRISAATGGADPVQQNFPMPQL